MTQPRVNVHDEPTRVAAPTHESAYRRGIESAAIARGKTHRQRNPYEPCSARWLAYARGWDAWVQMVLANREEVADAH